MRSQLLVVRDRNDPWVKPVFPRSTKARPPRCTLQKDLTGRGVKQRSKTQVASYCAGYSSSAVGLAVSLPSLFLEFHPCSQLHAQCTPEN